MSFPFSFFHLPSKNVFSGLSGTFSPKRSLTEKGIPFPFPDEVNLFFFPPHPPFQSHPLQTSTLVAPFLFFRHSHNRRSTFPFWRPPFFSFSFRFHLFLVGNCIKTLIRSSSKSPLLLFRFESLESIPSPLFSLKFFSPGARQS